MSAEPSQRIERVPGARRVRLTPVAGATAEPSAPHESEPDENRAASGPNDERMRREVPPHY